MPVPKAASRDAFSISNKLRKEHKSNDVFEIMLSNISFEELIALKLEIVARTVGANLYGLPLWKSIPYIVRDAMLKYALAATPSKTKAIRFLGLDKKEFYAYLTNYNIRNYYEEENKRDESDN